jgi:hypothetical protein
MATASLFLPMQVRYRVEQSKTINVFIMKNLITIFAVMLSITGLFGQDKISEAPAWFFSPPKGEYVGVSFPLNDREAAKRQAICTALLSCIVQHDMKGTYISRISGISSNINDPEGKSGEYVILNTVTHIEYAAIGACQYLTAITIPSSVTFMDENVFYACRNLAGVTVGWTTPPSISISDNIFKDVPLNTATLYVPAGTKAAYQAAPVWKNFGSIVEDSSQ